MARLPSRREGDLLVRPFDALLDPALLRRIGDVQEFDAERLAIGAAQDRDDLADGAEFEAEHVVEEDRAVEIGVAEAVGARIELFLVLAAARARADRDWRENGRARDRRGSASARGSNSRVARSTSAEERSTPRALRLRLDLAAERLVGLGPIAVERRDQLAALERRPVRPRPGRAARRSAPTSRGVVLEALEERLPLGVDRLRDRPRSGRRGLRYSRHCRRRGRK